ncbi:MAG TPA: hypothetical protein VF530_07630 [Planctomycetota bacterium]
MALVRPGRSTCRRAAALALVGLAGACVEDSSSSTPAPPPEDPEIHIDSPAGTVVHFGTSPIELAGEAAIDGWNSSLGLVEPNVRWVNVTTGASGEAAESVEWIWFLFGYYPTNHRWSAIVPLAPGANDLRVEAYYSTSGRTVGSDTLQVWWP